MRINIASGGGRSHLLDTAKELEKFGHQVRFYSYVPTKRAIKFGLKKECNRTYFILALPFLALLKLTKRANWALFIFHYLFDYFTAWYMQTCDVFIGHSPMHVYSLKYAKKKYNAIIIIERGTSHIFNYIKLLENNPALNGKKIMPEMFIKRDLSGYELADYISIPSEFSKKSFLKYGILNEKIFVNPYGVNLKQFKPTALDENDIYDLIIVGQWSYRKGCDMLTDVCKKYNFRLIHVGAIIDVPFPESSNMVHIDPVDEKELVKYYSKSRVFILPSREDGFGLVLPQAIACGLPIVCSKNTGGPDLKQLISDKKWIIEMEDLSVDDMGICIHNALELSKGQVGLRCYSEEISNYFSWDAYGKRYNDFLKNI